ncbi:Hint domain-containing protein [Paracoccus luteus]|uniref:Hint domain-containing protein n=1 Tax=Paracoccus luteus TaxID=2508543 RepID=UPI0010702ABF|nr:Hint domain-containing protein [Paracoccus luteus]
MPYVTLLSPGFLSVDADAGVIDLGGTQILNNLQPSQSFDLYDVDDTGATTLNRGDAIRPVTTDGTTVGFAGTYVGAGTFATTATPVGLPPLAGVYVQLNPVDGYFIDGDDGNTYFVSDVPLSGNNVGVTVTGAVLGVPLAEPINLPLSQLGEAQVLGPVLDPVLDAVNDTLNTVVDDIEYQPDVPLPLDADDVYCFAAGTLILTPAGEVAVETLVAGDLVMTRDRGAQPVRWVGARSVSAAGLARNPKLRPIRIRAGALGDGLPASDLVVSPQHRILVRSRIAQRMFGTDEILVAAKQLLQLDGIDIARDMDRVDYVRFMFDRHEVVFSNGAEAESLYTGPEALKAVGTAARDEILALFPELRDGGHAAEPARPLASGRMARKLAVRHAVNGRPLVH